MLRFLKSGLGWDDLLQSQRILIVAEAGAGKTHECQTQQKALWDEGQAAFFVELSELSRNPLPDLLSLEERARFIAWHDSGWETATFFLDSIDELKLTMNSFGTALNRLRHAVDGQMHRVRLVVTTRPVPFDRKAIQRHLPVVEPQGTPEEKLSFAEIAVGQVQRPDTPGMAKPPPKWREVALLPLSDPQKRAFARQQGVQDIDALMGDIARRSAVAFAERPLDLIGLCADWKAGHRLRTHSEQIRNGIAAKLEPRTDRLEPAELSGEQAMDGAMRLALAALLTGKLTIRHSAEADRDGPEAPALEPARILADWKPDEIKALLERPLFGFVSYGRVRFHNRAILEFLAAERLARKQSGGLPLKTIKRLLFAETPYGQKIVKPSMRPVASWLSARLRPVQTEVLKREPEVLFDYGDPAALSSADRIAALEAFVAKHGHGGWRGLQIPQLQVVRFASAELGSCVARLWRDGIENPEVKELLLRLVEAAPLKECADLAYAAAVDAAEDSSVRLAAVKAVIALADQRLPSLIEGMETDPALWPDALMRKILAYTEPGWMPVEPLCRILARIPPSRKTTGEIEWFLGRAILESDMPRAMAERWLRNLTPLVTEGLVWSNDHYHMTSRRPHLASALAAICLKLLRAGERRDDLAAASVTALRLCQDNDHRSEPAKALRDFLGTADGALRRHFFWADDAVVRSTKRELEPFERCWRLGSRAALRLAYELDSQWILSDLADRSRDALDREFMFEVAIRHGLNPGKDWADELARLGTIVSDLPGLAARIDRLLAPQTVDPEFQAYDAETATERADREAEKARHLQEWAAFQQEVIDQPDLAFEPKRMRATVENLWKAMGNAGQALDRADEGDQDETIGEPTGWNRRFIETHFDKTIADRLRSAMMKHWRGETVPLRSERPADERNSYFRRWKIGLTGLSAEAEDPNWVRKLTAEEAKRAARYAPQQLNGFPGWVSALARAHPRAIEETLAKELSWELTQPAFTNSHDDMLQRVAYAAPEIAKLFVPALREWLTAWAELVSQQADEPRLGWRLRHVIHILLTYGGDEAHTALQAIATGRVVAESESPLATLWLETLLRIDPVQGTQALEDRLRNIEPTADGPAIDMFGRLFEGRQRDTRVDLGHRGFTPNLLLRLLRLAYEHVRIADDIQHEGAYSPGRRDDAQSARNEILGALLARKGFDAWTAKSALIANPLFAHAKDRFAVLARESAAEEIDHSKWNEDDVVALDKHGDTPPKTTHEFFSVLNDRLDDLHDHLRDDTSPRETWQREGDERRMRRLIAGRLETTACNAYSASQESVTADENRTDIRLQSAACDEQAVIELKIGEKWSAKELRDAIRNQLVDRYLAAARSRSGCLLVTVAKEGSWRHPDTGTLLDTLGLKALLSAEAARVQAESQGELLVSAKILDLRSPLAPSARNQRSTTAQRRLV